jgi:phosphotransferase system HPr (HPr) family protein
VIEGELRIANRLGLHARAAARLVNLLKDYRSEVWFCRPGEGRRVDARSIICLIGMGAACGTRLHFDISGIDETETLRAMQLLFDSGFDESA